MPSLVSVFSAIIFSAMCIMAGLFFAANFAHAEVIEGAEELLIAS